MKLKFTLIFTLLLGSITIYTSQAQDYLPVAVEGAQSLFYSRDDDYLPPWYDYYFGYYISGDIIIDGTTYKKVYYRNFSPIYYNPEEGLSYPPLQITNEVLVGAIRDDIPNRLVYAIQFCDDFPYSLQDETLFSDDCACYEEHILYDFSLNAGDHIDDMCIIEGNPENHNVFATDNVELFNENRDIYEIHNGVEYKGIMIEGIGGAHRGLFGTLYQDEYIGLDFLDYKIGGNEAELDGVWALGNIDNSINADITIYPIPTQKNIHINTPNDIEIDSVNLYNVLGKLILQINENCNDFNINNVNNGLLVLEIVTNKGIFFKKVIKE